MGDGIEAIQKRQMRLVPLRRMVDGIWYRIDFHFPLLASSGLRWLADSFWCCICDQSHFRNLRVLLQFQTYSTDRTRQGKETQDQSYVAIEYVT